MWGLLRRSLVLRARASARSNVCARSRGAQVGVGRHGRHRGLRNRGAALTLPIERSARIARCWVGPTPDGLRSGDGMSFYVKEKLPVGVAVDVAALVDGTGSGTV